MSKPTEIYFKAEKTGQLQRWGEGGKILFVRWPKRGELEGQRSINKRMKSEPGEKLLTWGKKAVGWGVNRREIDTPSGREVRDFDQRTARIHAAFLGTEARGKEKKSFYRNRL